MLEMPERINYREWDNQDFIIPTELQLTNKSFFHEAIQVFIKQGDMTFLKLLIQKNMQRNG